MTAGLSWSPGNPFVGDGLPGPAEPAEIVVFIAGRAAPQGSKKPVGRGRMVESSKYLKRWRKAVQDAMVRDGRKVHGLVEVEARFIFPRPKGRVNEITAGLGKDKGDGDKLTRAVWDALTAAGTIDDDARVLDWHGGKRLAEPNEEPGVLIIIRPWKG